MIDILIIGAGPAGCQAAIYLKRFNKNPLVIASNESTLSSAHLVENYYGVPSITGDDLYSTGLAQLKKLEVSVKEETVINIEYYGHFVVTTTSNVYEAKKVILATGKARNKLKIKNVSKYELNGLSYCAVCDGFFYRNQKVGLIGSGSSMLHELEFLKGITSDITVFTDGVDIELEGVKVCKEKIVSLFGETYLEGVETTDCKYPIDGLFAAIGDASTFDFIKRLGIATDDKNNIVVSENYQTNIPNLYAIGDAIGGVLQVVKAAYDGMMVAYCIQGGE